MFKTNTPAKQGQKKHKAVAQPRHTPQGAAFLIIIGVRFGYASGSAAGSSASESSSSRRACTTTWANLFISGR